LHILIGLQGLADGQTDALTIFKIGHLHNMQLCWRPAKMQDQTHRPNHSNKNRATLKNAEQST